MEYTTTKGADRHCPASSLWVDNELRSWTTMDAWLPDFEEGDIWTPITFQGARRARHVLRGSNHYELPLRKIVLTPSLCRILTILYEKHHHWPALSLP